MKDQTAKADGGKTSPILLFKDLAISLRLVQAVFDYGEQKYDRKSWRKVALERWDDAQRRHQQNIDLGEMTDDESALLHRAHQIAGLIIMNQLEFEEYAASRTGSTVRILERLCKFNTPPQNHKETKVEKEPEKCCGVPALCFDVSCVRHKV